MKAVGKFYNLSGEMEYFFTIPEFPNYLISKSGSVINEFDHSPERPYVSKTGYVFFRLTTMEGKTYLGGRHRLLLQTFKPKEGYENMYANHINGIKGDDILTNLEWTTPQENVEHAGKHGLTKKCIAIQVRNNLTGIVDTYPSYRKCSAALGISKDIVAWRASTNGSRLYPDGYQYRTRSEEEWPDVSNQTVREGRNMPVAIRQLESGDVSIFPSQRAAAKYLGNSEAYVSEWLRNPAQPVLTGLIQIKYLDDAWIDHADPLTSLELSTGKRVVIVKDVDRGVDIWYHSAVECARANGLKPTALSYRLKTNGMVIFQDGKTYQYHKPSSPLRVTEE